MGELLVLDMVPEDPAVFSRTAATQGQHSTLLAPTGASLLGWAARHNYVRLRPSYQHRAFHSGLVRFSDAVPVHDGQPVYPRPAILFRPKQGEGDAVLGREEFDRRYGNDRQAEAIGMCYVTRHGQAAPARATGHRLRNSRQSDSLFGYQHLAPEGAYRAVIEIDGDEPGVAGFAAAMADCFFGQLFLGRGSRTGYGGAYRCTPSIGESPWPGPQNTDGRPMVRLWCLSDVAMFDEQCGVPKSIIEPEDVGLHGWVLDRAESAARMRRYAPWNGALKCRDTEIAAIEAGAVFTFRWAGSGPAPDVLVPAVIGAHRERGLGRVTLIPEQFGFRPWQGSGRRVEAEPAEQVPQPNTDLVKWAWARTQSRATEANQLRWLAQVEADLENLAGQLRDGFPSPAQWQQISLAARPENLLSRGAWKSSVAMPDRWPGMRMADEDARQFRPLSEWVLERLVANPDDLGLPMSERQHQAALAMAIKTASRLARGFQQDGVQ